MLIKPLNVFGPILYHGDNKARKTNGPYLQETYILLEGTDSQLNTVFKLHIRITLGRKSLSHCDQD